MINENLRAVPNLGSFTNKEADAGEEQDRAVVARVLSNFRAKDECKQVRRDQNHVKRRMARAHGDISYGSSSISGNRTQQQHWRLMELLMDSVPEGPLKKPNCFVSLLPPPPPRTASKILPPTSPRNNPSPHPSSRHIPVKVRGRSQIIKTPAEEHQRDEEGWLGGQSNVIKKPAENEGPSNSNPNIVYGASSIYSHFPLPNTGKITASALDSIIQHEQSFSRTRPFCSQDPSQLVPDQIKVPTRAHIAGTRYTGGFHRVAQAVQIRSVIPVCAAPPPVIQTSNPPTVKETSPSALNAAPPTSVLSTEKGEEISSACSKVNNPQTCLTELNFEFNKLQL